MTTIMVVDDDQDIRELIRIHLHGEGFQVTEAGHGKEAVRILKKTKVELVVVDVMMPYMDGWDLCRFLKEEYPDIPIILVTAKREINQKIKGFNLGADDYLVKPFDPLELVIRIRALLRRYRIEASMKLQIGDIVLDKHKYEVVMDEERIALPLKEFDILFKLAGSPGKIFTRKELIGQIWGPHFFGDERTVDVHIKRIRERFPQETYSFTIVTKRGLGYKLEMMPS